MYAKHISQIQFQVGASRFSSSRMLQESFDLQMYVTRIFPRESNGVKSSMSISLKKTAVFKTAIVIYLARADGVNLILIPFHAKLSVNRN